MAPVTGWKDKAQRTVTFVLSNGPALIGALAFLLVTGFVATLAGIAVKGFPTRAWSEVGLSNTLLAAVLGAWIISLVMGAVLIREARPHTGSWIGRLIAWLGIGLVLISLAVMLTFTHAIFGSDPASSSIAPSDSTSGSAVQPQEHSAQPR